ncbi:MAG: glycosyltransferase family 4 protein [Syntrophobacterales bacterium]|nr:glycosyltransferase family 4 protein [Syntrophobacterales bacterium]
MTKLTAPIHLAYYFSIFPALTTTFAQHQVRATEKLGLNFLLLANRRPAPDNFHPQDQDLQQRTFYLTPVQVRVYLKANLRAWKRWPRRYAATLDLAFRLRDKSPGPRLKNFGQLAGAAVLAEHLLACRAPHVHVHFAYGAAAVALFLEALCGLPYSLSIHGSDVLLDNPLLEDKLRGARFIISNCHFHVENLRRRFPSLATQRFYVVPGGLDLQAPPWSTPAPPGTDLPLRILHIGRLVPVKAQEVLILALARLRDLGEGFQCRIVGDGPLREELQNLVVSLNLQDRVQFLGVRYEAEVAQLYDWSQVLVLSSRSEGTPMVIIEAMAKARAVIAPRITAIPEMVEEGRTGYLFTPGNAVDLADQFFRLLSQPADLIRLGLEGRRQAENLFDLRRNARKLMNVFARELPWVPGDRGVNPE